TLSMTGSGQLNLYLARQSGGTGWSSESSSVVCSCDINNNGSFTASTNSTLTCYGGGNTNAFNNNAGASFAKQGTGTAQFTVNSRSEERRVGKDGKPQGATQQMKEGGTHAGAQFSLTEG